MLTPNVWNKPVSDVRTITIDESDSLATADSISSVGITCDSTAIVIASPVINSPFIYVQIGGGVLGGVYNLFFEIDTAADDRINEKLKIRIIEG